MGKYFKAAGNPDIELLNDNEPESEENGETIENESHDDSDWENRVLCADGNCIGVIGPDGFCKECGKPCEPGETAAGSHETKDRSAGSDTDEEPEWQTENTPVPDNDKGPELLSGGITDKDDMDYPGDEDTEWENRRLCSDGNCIGVVGPDGRCKECGKPYEEPGEQ